MYANLSAITKIHRATQIIADIGSNGFMKFYTGAIPPTPDNTPGGILLASLPLSSPAAIVSLCVLTGVVTAAGSGGTDGTYTLIITPAMADPGTGAVGIFTVSGGVLATIQISSNGSGYVVPPTFSGFVVAGLSSATASPVMTAITVFGTIGAATGVASGTASFVRVGTTGGTGVLDLDVGATNDFSVVMSNTFITLGASVTCTTDRMIEG
jgi:hypothetical protein